MNTKCELDGLGNKYWYQDDRLHRVEWSYGIKEWYQDGRYHRLDGPAIEYPDGGKSWFQNGKEYEFKEEWFQDLPQEDKQKMIWKLDEF